MNESNKNPISPPSIHEGAPRETMLALQLTTNAPWIQYLPEEDQHIFFLEAVSEMVDAARTGRDGDIRDLLRKWEATAEIHASPELMDQFSAPDIEEEYTSLDYSNNRA